MRIHRFRRQGMTIGEGCVIASSTRLDQTNPSGVHIGSHTILSFNTSVLTHDFVNSRHVDTYIGSNCFIGAHAIVMPGVTIGDNVIVGAGSVVFSDVPSRCIVLGNPARIIERDIVTGRFGIRSPNFLEKEGIKAPESMDDTAMVAEPVSRQAFANASPSRLVDDAGAGVSELEDLRQRYFGKMDMDRPFADSAVDSFALIALRAEIEHSENITIPDAEWLAVETPKDLMAIVHSRRNVGKQADVQAPAPASDAASLSRAFEITMPLMSRKGLSEGWLFKEMGDMHWTLICSALGVRSSEIANQDGDRLYATFTRILYDSTVALSKLKENDLLVLKANISRFGAGIFKSTIEIESGENKINAQLMSSFAQFGTKGDNNSLMKGQPTIPENFPIPAEATMPDFVQEYRDVRANEIPVALFSTDYQIVPVHDINGVGLLYFAAYPSIADICIDRYAASKGVELFARTRDLYYFSNSGPDEKITYHLVQWDERGGSVTTRAFLVRSDGKKMAEIRAEYAMHERL